MPVPVSVISKLQAHQVSKQRSHPGPQHFPIHTLTHSLPLPPPGPPPSYGTREEWISSLPDWRRNKPRRIWEEDDSTHSNMQGFPSGLTNAANAFVIKGQRAQACIPPQNSRIDSHPPVFAVPASQDDVSMTADDDEMDSSFEFDVESQWSGQSPSSSGHGMDVDDRSHNRSMSVPQYLVNQVAGAYSAQGVHYGRTSFTPVFEATSPDHDDRADPGSSPLGPVTPFGDFVDRAVATVGYERNAFTSAHGAPFPPFAHKIEPPYAPSPPEPVPEPVRVPAPESVSAPTSSLTYKKVADPLAEWMAAYVWKACTTGMSLPQRFQPRMGQHELRYSSLPPPYLADAIRSLLMSTLLQPSAIILCIWYLVRLPICFGAMNQGAEHPEEALFRSEIFGKNEWRGITEREVIEADAPFRLILLGCMLANKWLDDHTFSNRTWHQISGVPIQSLNRLEFYALGLFGHDLSVPSEAWIQWLDHILAHHATSSPIGPPQPISRPSSDPRAIIRRTVEHIFDISNQLAAARACDEPSCPHSHVEPVFTNLDERKPTTAQLPIELEIDLDEDGPLREEYVPKRRISRAGADRPVDGWAAERALPPPARWSPDADEPLARGSHDRGQQYVAVQPPPAPLLQPTRTFATWSVPSIAPPAHKLQLPPIYASAAPPSHPHVRSISLSNAPPGLDAHTVHHGRSISHQQFNHGPSDMRMTVNSGFSEPYWLGRPGGYGFTPFEAMPFPSSANWIRV